MANLNSIERRLLEETLEMGGGHVLDFTRADLASAVQDAVGLNLFSSRYEIYGDSKAKRLRALWDIEDGAVVGQVINYLLDHAGAFDLASTETIEKCRGIAAKLTGKLPSSAPTENDFLSEDFPHVDFQKLPIEGALIPIMEGRWEEAKRCSETNAHLSVVILLGSLLEALLLGAAQRNPKAYNTAPAAPVRDGKVPPFYSWSLADLIDVSAQLGLINLDVKKHSHSLRDFRNYVHPYQQAATKFSPDRDTTNIAVQVFRAAANQLANSSSEKV